MSSKTILIVDDSKTAQLINQKCCGIALPPEQLQFVTADNGQIGLDILKSQSVDLVLSDINMPVMSGVEMLESLRQVSMFDNLPFILVSSNITQNDEDALLEKGATFVIKKPMSPMKVQEAFEKLGWIS